MPVHSDTDDRGKYYQWGESGKKYYVDEFGEGGAKRKAYEQASAIEHSGYKEKSFKNIEMDKWESR